MNIDKVIKWFMPKEERFHELLEKATQNLLLGARSSRRSPTPRASRTAR